jgi:hypothetical protein
VTDDRDLVPALGGTRLIPAPDPIASDYLLLGLRLDQHIPGLVDSYYGPADLKARADLEQRRPPARLLDDIAALSERVEREVEAPDRRTWFLAQLGALDAHTRALAGQPLSYIDHVERCLGYPPRRHADHEFDDAVAAIDDLLPGAGSIPDRLDAWTTRSRSPRERSRRSANGYLTGSASGHGGTSAFPRVRPCASRPPAISRGWPTTGSSALDARPSR